MNPYCNCNASYILASYPYTEESLQHMQSLLEQEEWDSDKYSELYEKIQDMKWNLGKNKSDEVIDREIFENQRRELRRIEQQQRELQQRELQQRELQQRELERMEALLEQEERESDKYWELYEKIQDMKWYLGKNKFDEVIDREIFENQRKELWRIEQERIEQQQRELQQRELQQREQRKREQKEQRKKELQRLNHQRQLRRMNEQFRYPYTTAPQVISPKKQYTPMYREYPSHNVDQQRPYDSFVYPPN